MTKAGRVAVQTAARWPSLGHASRFPPSSTVRVWGEPCSHCCRSSPKQKKKGGPTPCSAVCGDPGVPMSPLGVACGFSFPMNPLSVSCPPPTPPQPGATSRGLYAPPATASRSALEVGVVPAVTRRWPLIPDPCSYPAGVTATWLPAPFCPGKGPAAHAPQCARRRRATRPSPREHGLQ